ncbi:alpha-amylase [Sebaldella termitidis]|uniref:alpha-amylase n=1 Tax=Sebaldella termitidis TaxID=826 RepID=UPI003EBE941D
MENGVMIQYFEWNLPADKKHWKRLADDAEHLKDIGINAVWIPPATKGTSDLDVGYGAYDLYDLGEFDQKGTVATKYGTKEELITAIEALHEREISVYLDAVMNHKAGADETERFMVQEVDPNDRNKAISDPYEIEGWTKFNFDGRNNKYSDFKWHWYHFNGTDYNNINQKTAIYKMTGDGKNWDQGVDDENGNYDYLMFANIDYERGDVVEEMKRWGVWVANELNLDGFRLDAIKHINNTFIEEFLKEVRGVRGEDFYAVGEYWKGDLGSIVEYLDNVNYQADLFDVPLHFNFFTASKNGSAYDLREVFNNSLVVNKKLFSVTFVDNHDSQWGSSLESQIDSWFKPLAYALILLIADGYPCIFYGDYYGVGGKESPHRWIIEKLLYARKNYAYGEQINYFDDPNLIGMVRKGNEDHPGSGLVMLLSNHTEGTKKINIGKEHAGEIWYEITENIKDEIHIDDNGEAEFKVNAGKAAVWVKKQ